MATLPLSLAVSDYDHVRDLLDGRVALEGVTLAVEQPPVGQIFQRALRGAAWDVHEMSMGMYVARLAAGERGLTAIPVFPSRVFRLSAFYVRDDDRVRRPEDLRGRRIGDPDWAMTAGIYARAWLQHAIGIPLAAIDWVQAGLDAPGRVETLRFAFPPGLRRGSRPDASLDQLLREGAIDAVIAAEPPASARSPGGGIRRLLPDAAAAEQDYARRTGLFPIMHVIALRRDLAAAHPWLAPRLLAGFEAAKRRSLARLADGMASRFPWPWAWAAAEQARTLFGPDPWPYGVAANRRTLEAFLDFCAEQGVGERRVGLEELFVPGAEEPG